jgi:ferredoxin
VIWYDTIKYTMEVIIMAFKINDDCISCGACESECPVSCISQGDGKYVIDPDACVECGACASVCPVGAPQQD